MRNILVIILSVLLVTAVAFGQDDKPFTAKGDKALLFEFSGLANLGANSFNGGIGAKYFLSQDMAIRGGFQVASISEDYPFQGTGGADGEAFASSFGISAAIEFHLNTKRVSPYYGGGVGLSFTSTESKSTVANPDNQVTIKNDSNGEFGYFAGTQIEVFGLLGAEVFILDNFSLAAEYRLGFSSLSRKDEEVTQGTQTTTTKQGSRQVFGLASAGVLTLAIYF